MKDQPDLNYPAFFHAERELRRRGWIVINPAINPFLLFYFADISGYPRFMYRS